MAKTAFLLGGTGQTGRALVPRLRARGWNVVAASRGERAALEDLDLDAELVTVDRADGDALRRALGSGADVLVDFVAFDAQHAEQLLSLRDLVGSLVVLSSASVYTDAEDRALDEATGPDDFPRVRVPILESGRTFEPGDANYSTKKVALERRLLESGRLPVTIVRPGAIHGPGGNLPREWHFVKRALDGRRHVLFANRGFGRFHTTATENLAALLTIVAERPATHILNCGDPSPPTVLEIGRAIASAMEVEWAELLLPVPARDGELGMTPWSVPRDFVLDMTEAELLGYRPVTTYGEAVTATCRWLAGMTEGRDWRELWPEPAERMAESFDYAREDEFVAQLAATGG
jgi:nucleoside-diphosphate-sugar epimerase